jgi:hypothetical protein
MEQLGLPRAAFVRFPRGATIGAPNDAPQQISVLRQALSLLESAASPGTIAEVVARADL